MSRLPHLAQQTAWTAGAALRHPLIDHRRRDHRQHHDAEDQQRGVDDVVERFLSI
jgi:hypothetical protein